MAIAFYAAYSFTPTAYIDNASGDLCLRWGFQSRTIALAAKSPGEVFCEGRVWQCVQRGSDAYLVITIANSSRNNNGEGYCGCGIEESLYWIKLNNHLKLQASQNALIDSCYENIYKESVTTQNTLLCFHYGSSKCDFHASFNPAKPQAGLHIYTTPPQL